VASWFETRGAAALLTMRVQDLILRSGLLAASRRMKPPNRKMHYTALKCGTLSAISCGTGAAQVRPGSMVLTCADDGELAIPLEKGF